ncbi:hypothetical protein EDD85DRAFT_794369 [Armillaria nabsnona]|nr:hypothetical protein EDD85DRAFT_794369 [Armillaria nabsnona]
MSGILFKSGYLLTSSLEGAEFVVWDPRHYSLFDARSVLPQLLSSRQPHEEFDALRKAEISQEEPNTVYWYLCVIEDQPRLIDVFCGPYNLSPSAHKTVHNTRCCEAAYGSRLIDLSGGLSWEKTRFLSQSRSLLIVVSATPSADWPTGGALPPVEDDISLSKLYQLFKHFDPEIQTSSGSDPRPSHPVTLVDDGSSGTNPRLTWGDKL